MSKKITIRTLVRIDKQKAWDYYTKPEHITKWNFADSSWHCPFASNKLIVGGQYMARMEAKDGSFGFDFQATYQTVNIGSDFTYEFGGRFAKVEFRTLQDATMIEINFDAETEHPIALQRKGWQSILNHFKHYAEVQNYLDGFPEDCKRVLMEIRACILKVVPNATECLNYGVLAYTLMDGGKLDQQLMVGGFKNHVGIYPHPSTIAHFEKDLNAYKFGKGSVQFPLDKPLPVELIEDMIRYRMHLLQNHPY